MRRERRQGFETVVQTQMIRQKEERHGFSEGRGRKFIQKVETDGWSDKVEP